MYGVYFENQNGDLSLSHVCPKSEVEFWRDSGYFVRPL